MAIVYLKRYRMQIDLRDYSLEKLSIPRHVRFHPWHYDLLEAHAEAKFHSFRNELDMNVFPCLGDADGCLRLMKEISCRQGFVPESTWLATYRNPQTGRRENCGTVQGVSEKFDVGMIQNIGVVKSRRGMGIGSLLIQHSLQGFLRAGIHFVTLEVTSQNSAACRLYERLGFRLLRTVYKSVEISDVV